MFQSECGVLSGLAKFLVANFLATNFLVTNFLATGAAKLPYGHGWPLAAVKALREGVFRTKKAVCYEQVS